MLESSHVVNCERFFFSEFALCAPSRSFWHDKQLVGAEPNLMWWGGGGELRSI